MASRWLTGLNKTFKPKSSDRTVRHRKDKAALVKLSKWSFFIVMGPLCVQHWLQYTGKNVWLYDKHVEPGSAFPGLQCNVIICKGIILLFAFKYMRQSLILCIQIYNKNTNSSGGTSIFKDSSHVGATEQNRSDDKQLITARNVTLVALQVKCFNWSDPSCCLPANSELLHYWCIPLSMSELEFCQWLFYFPQDINTALL